MKNKKYSIESRNKLIVKNKKAYKNYVLKDTFEAGIILNGWEIKSIRKNNVQLIESYIKIFSKNL